MKSNTRTAGRIKDREVRPKRTFKSNKTPKVAETP
jgi:hypothetical protein